MTVDDIVGYVRLVIVLVVLWASLVLLTRVDHEP